MPNWCDNQVLIRGPKEEVLKIKEKLHNLQTNNPFDFNAINKCPQVLLDETAPQRNQQRGEYLIKHYGARDWYDWCNNNWGTKWNSSDAHVDDPYDYDNDEVVLKYGFMTAWAPPFPVIEKLAEDHPNTNIYMCFEEPGMNFAGWRYYSGGELENEEDYDASYSNMRAHLEPDVDIWEWVE